MSLPRLSPFLPLRKARLITRQLVLRLSDTTFITARRVQLRVEKLTPRVRDREQTSLLHQMDLLLMSDSPVVRQAAVGALGRIRSSQPEVVKFVRLQIARALDDENQQVRDEAERIQKSMEKSEPLSKKA